MYAAFLAVGWIASRRVREGTAAELIVAGRNMPVWVAALTMTATWVDGGYLLGTTEGVYKSSIQLGIQGGLCFGISLLVGGGIFAGIMRRAGFTTLIDPFERRFGKRWAAILFLPALAGELFWSAELLVAIGSTFGVLLGMNLTNAILLSAVVTTAYTVLGGMWSVAYTDIFQLGLVVVGLAAALPYALDAAGGLAHGWTAYLAARPDGAGVMPPFGAPTPLWTPGATIGWWDVSLMLVFGGVPWNCYFQRVLSCRTPADAQRQSLLAGVLTMAFTVPPLLMGVAAFAYPWSAADAATLQATPAEAMPLLFARAVPPVVGLLGLAAIIGAVTSSFSSSILSAGSMLSWNCVKRLVWPAVSVRGMKRVIRASIFLFGALARFSRCACRACRRSGSSRAISSSCCSFHNCCSRCSIRAPTCRARSPRSWSRSCCGSAAANRCWGCRRSFTIPIPCRSGRLPRRRGCSCCRWCRAPRRAGTRRVRSTTRFRQRPRPDTCARCSPGSCTCTPRWGWCARPASPC